MAEVRPLTVTLTARWWEPVTRRLCVLTLLLFSEWRVRYSLSTQPLENESDSLTFRT